VPPRTIARTASRSDALRRYCESAFMDCLVAYFLGVGALLE
jgi:hypothetical protein